MAVIKAVNGVTPVFGNHCFLANKAMVTGDVVMGDDCSVWFDAVVRGAVHSISLLNIRE